MIGMPIHSTATIHASVRNRNRCVMAAVILRRCSGMPLDIDGITSTHALAVKPCKHAPSVREISQHAKKLLLTKLKG